MLIDRILYPVTTLGPGKRLVIWTQGCSKRCINCASRGLWDFDKRKEMKVEDCISSIKKYLSSEEIDGITISGGDPVEQPQELLKLVKGLKQISDDIIVYTGYEFSELTELFDNNYIKELKNNVAVLITGRYVDEKNDNKSVLIGSTNQEIHYFNNKYKEKYMQYLSEGRKIQNVYCGNGMISVGIHNKDGGSI